MNVVGAFCDYANELKNSNICHCSNNQSAEGGKNSHLQNVVSGKPEAMDSAQYSLHITAEHSHTYKRKGLFEIAAACELSVELRRDVSPLVEWWQTFRIKVVVSYSRVEMWYVGETKSSSC
jgi:hypothetical protein